LTSFLDTHINLRPLYYYDFVRRRRSLSLQVSRSTVHIYCSWVVVGEANPLLDHMGRVCCSTMAWSSQWISPRRRPGHQPPRSFGFLSWMDTEACAEFIQALLHCYFFLRVLLLRFLSCCLLNQSTVSILGSSLPTGPMHMMHLCLLCVCPKTHMESKSLLFCIHSCGKDGDFDDSLSLFSTDVSFAS
jgi:hypothetical protein